jgi:DoxX-like protein
VAINLLRSGKAYTALGAFMAFDAVIYAIPLPFVTEGLDKVEFPSRYRWIFPPIKAAAAVGLVAAKRFPALGRLTTAMLTLYFALAVGSHVRARDFTGSIGAAGIFLAVFGTMAAIGPPRDSA